MAEVLKERINREFLTSLAKNLAQVDREFQAQGFLSELLNQEWAGLELKARIRRTAKVLGEFLSGGYPEQLETLKKVVAGYSGLSGLVFPDFVEVRGMNHFKASVEALKVFTPYSSSEFAIRPFIKAHPEKMLSIMTKWSKDKDPHVRRLASEGCRPRLPWSFKLQVFVDNPAPVLALLENLKNDDSLYVRKSVANNLNDISKDHPEKVLHLARRWQGKTANTDWIIRHALRTLLKRGDKKALSLFGHDKAKGVRVRSLKFENKGFKIGGDLKFSFVLENTAKKRRSLRVEYAIHYVKKGGQWSRKVFQLTEKEFAFGSARITKKHSLRQMTTRQHYPGRHRLEVIVNGETMSKGDFLLL